MKWIKSRSQWLSEAKIRDLVFKRQADEIRSVWGEKYLDYEEVTPTEKIIQGKWKLSEADKMTALSAFFDCNMTAVTQLFSNLPDKFNFVLSQSLDLEQLGPSEKTVLEELNIQAPSIDQMVFIFDSVFRKLAISETGATEMIQKDQAGRPIRDEEGNMMRIKKNAGDPVFTNNLVNINSFVDDYNRCYQDDKVEVNFQNRNLSQLRNLAKDNHNRDYNFEFNIFGKDLYLQIEHSPKDILNMAISKFYSSCQHLYTGGYRSRLLGNVFDPNSIPALLVFDSPITYGNDIISDKLPLSRMMIRNIESFEETTEPKIFFDRAYPDRMKEVFDEIVNTYSKNDENVDDTTQYVFSPDIEFDDRKIEDPYMDKLSSKRVKMIGINTKTLYLSHTYDWSKTKIAAGAKIKELIIETTDIPENLFEIKIELEWIKFRNLKLKSIKGFENLGTDSIAFDKCRLDDTIIEELLMTKPDIKAIQIISSEIGGKLDFTKFKKLQELHLVFTLDSLDEISALENTNIKKLVLSGDLIKDKEAKAQIAQFRQRGIKVDIVGPVI